MIIFDEVLEAIECSIARFEPERGGLLFGPSGRNVVALFMPDENAHTTAVSYTVSREMARRAPEIEKETGLEYKGVVHSHPASLDHPSFGDHDSAANALAVNPHLGGFLMPIVTRRPLDRKTSRPHETPLESGRMGAFVAHRGRKGGASVDVREAKVSIVPAAACLRDVCEHLVSSGACTLAFLSSPGVRVMNEGAMSLAYTLHADDRRVVVIAGESFPFHAPHLLDADDSAQARALPVSWSLGCDPVSQIVEAMVGVTSPPDSPARRPVIRTRRRMRVVRQPAKSRKRVIIVRRKPQPSTSKPNHKKDTP